MDKPMNPTRIKLNLRLKLVIGFGIISAMVAGITARGIYINLKISSFDAAVQSTFVTTSLAVTIVAVLLGLFFGYVTGSLLTDPIKKLANSTKKLAAGDFTNRIALVTGDEVEDLGQAFNAMASELQTLVSNLEQRVAVRTEELAHRTEELERLSTITQARAKKLRAIAEVARGIALVQNLDQLLPAIATVVSQEFSFYHVGIFLNDDTNEYAVLRAANSEGGQRMLARGHRLQIGQVGLVGTVAAAGRARIASDTGADAVFFNNPDLSETHSEIALPLRSGRNIIGVLDVQSEVSAAFSQEDVELLTILADQVSTAIRNARLFAETQRALTESENATRQYVRQQWGDIIDQAQIAGVQYTGTELKTLAETTMHETIFMSQVVNNVLSIPIKIRSEVLGTINIRSMDKTEWDEDDIDIVEAAAQRVALALENARLLQDAQRRASKERVIGDISTKLSSSVNIDNILRTALQELGQVIPGSEIFVEFEQGEKE